MLKPLDIDEVQEAVDLVKNEIASSIVSSEINEIKNLIHEFHTSETNARLRIPVKNGFQFIPCEEIIMLRSNLNLCLFFRLNDETMTSSKNLNYYSSRLPEHDFIQVSRSYIINIKHLLRYSVEDGGLYIKKTIARPHYLQNTKMVFLMPWIINHSLLPKYNYIHFLHFLFSDLNCLTFTVISL